MKGRFSDGSIKSQEEILMTQGPLGEVLGRVGLDASGQIGSARNEPGMGAKWAEGRLDSFWRSHYGSVVSAFTWVDWMVVFAYLGLTTWVGHLMRGRQGTIKDFFAGGKSLPWWAVCGSIIATEISGVTFIGVPGGVMAANGDFTYMLWGIGSIMGRVIVGVVFTKVFYQDEIYSPYDYMGKRIRPELKTLATVFFTIGSILGQSVRVLVAVIPLKVATGMPTEACILVVGVFAIGWTLMGGMRTVIWTDVMQFGLFTIGGLISLWWMVGAVDGGLGTFWAIAEEGGKTNMWDGRFGLGPELQFTFWVAIIAVPFQNLSAFGVDQLNAQRMFCCKSAADARKAVIFSSVGQVLTYLMLLVGAGLYVFYRTQEPSAEAAELLQFDEQGIPAKGDRVFPVWIVSELPVGLSGLILAGVFAASISSLDSILAALSQTTMSVLKNRGGKTFKSVDQASLVRESRMWVVIWGIFLTVFTLGLMVVNERLEISILSLAFGMTAYTMGPLLGMFLCALQGRGSYRGLLVGSVLSFILTALVRTDVWVLLQSLGMKVKWLAFLPTYELDEGKLQAVVGYFWMWPITTLITYFCGYIAATAKR